MPALEKLFRHQKAVLWEASGTDDYGEVTLDAAAEVTVRWTERQREGVDSQGNTIAIDASAVVDQQIAVGSIMWLGELVDLPAIPTNLKQVVNYGSVPDVKGREFWRTVLMIKYGNTLPVLA